MTPDDRFAELWTNSLEGELGDADQAELEGLLASDAALRERAADLYQAHRLLGFALQDSAAAGEAFVQSTLAGLPRADDVFVNAVLTRLPAAAVPGRRFLARTLAAVAAGLLLGVVVTSAAWAYAVPRTIERGQVLTVLDESFEQGPPPLVTGTPKESNVWAGDFTTVVRAQQGVAPAGGEKMLQILRADYDGKPNATGSYVGDLYRIVDLRPYRGDLADGETILKLSAKFNAAAFPDHERYGSALGVYAIAAETLANPAMLNTGALHNNALAMARKGRQPFDRDPKTWQRLDTELRLPAETDFVLVHLAVSHIGRSQMRENFDGHFIDDIRLTLTRRSPQP